MSEFLSRRFAGLQAYTPGEQPQDMQYLKLNTNESPYAPSPGVMERINRVEVEKLRLYPDPECRGLVRRLAQRYGVLPENIAVGNGSDELLAFSFMDRPGWLFRKSAMDSMKYTLLYWALMP